jgi:hypothetical protein
VATTAGPSGNWSVTGLDVSGLNDGTITYKATATDAALNANEDSKTATKDTVAPAVAVTSVTDPINKANQTRVSARGTAEPGAKVSLAVSASGRSTASTVTADSSGAWKVVGINVSRLKDGTITFTATATDAVGNANKASKKAAKHTKTPVIAVTSFTDPVSRANQRRLSASGKASPKARITVVITDRASHASNTVTTTANSSGKWKVSGLNASRLNDGAITYRVTATDAFGNSATACKKATKNTKARAASVHAIRAASDGQAVASGRLTATIISGGRSAAAHDAAMKSLLDGRAPWHAAKSGDWSLSKLL